MINFNQLEAQNQQTNSKSFQFKAVHYGIVLDLRLPNQLGIAFPIWAIGPAC